MARGPRLDCPGAVHHVLARGIERRPIFLDDRDRGDFLSRLAVLTTQWNCPIYAWTLMPNHVHLVLRSGRLGVSSLGRRLLGGYAGAFNRRHHRVGYLFQGRFKSTLVDADTYLLELVRYVHLNPLRAGLVGTLEDLDQHSWCGHGVLVGTHHNDWQDARAILEQFAECLPTARQRYRAFVAAGAAAPSSSAVAAETTYARQPFVRTSGRRRRGREEWTLDERILGRPNFVTQVLADTDPIAGPTGSLPPAARLSDTIRDSCAVAQVAEHEVRGASKRPRLVRVRQEICARAVLTLGLPVSQVASALHISARTVLRAIDRERLEGANRRR